MTDLAPGLTGESSVTVDVGNTAKTFGSGQADVLATPFLVALMERAACAALASAMAPGQGSVGTMIMVNHKAPTPIGMTATAKATLEEIDGRRLVFSLEARDENEIIGDGRHERFLIDNRKFQDKADGKKPKA